jgi:hypothetical protein
MLYEILWRYQSGERVHLSGRAFGSFHNRVLFLNRYAVANNEDMIAALDRGDALKKVLRRPRDVRIKPGLLQDRFARLKQQVVTAICEDAAPVD